MQRYHLFSSRLTAPFFRFPDSFLFLLWSSPTSFVSSFLHSSQVASSCLISSFLICSFLDSSLLSFLMLILNIALITYNGPNGLRQLTVIRHLSQTQLIKCFCRRSQESRDHVWHIISLWMPAITRLVLSRRQTRRITHCKTNSKRETP